MSGAGGFQCPSNLEGDCSNSPPGLVCPGAADASTAACACIPGTSGPSWQCAGGPCPATSPGTNGSCTSAQVSMTGGFYGCKYPPSTTCTCETTSDGGTAWSCNDVTCPIQVPTGSCPSMAPGLSCAYEGSDIVCICSPGDGGRPRWFCNGQPTPDCPADFPGLNGDCSAFRPGSACAYPVVNNIGGRCVCGVSGFGPVWLCPGGCTQPTWLASRTAGLNERSEFRKSACDRVGARVIAAASNITEPAPSVPTRHSKSFRVDFVDPGEDCLLAAGNECEALGGSREETEWSGIPTVSVGQDWADVCAWLLRLRACSPVADDQVTGRRPPSPR